MPFLKRLPDDITPDEVRAFRAGRGWTPEQLADVIGGSPTEVRAWEAGVVRVPFDQAYLIDALVATDQWFARVVEAGLPACPWVESERPGFHERLIACRGKTDKDDDDELRAHVHACAACTRVRRFALHVPHFPVVEVPHPKAMIRSRFGRFIERLPGSLGMAVLVAPTIPMIALIVVLDDDEPSATLDRNLAVLMGVSCVGIAYQVSGRLLRSRLQRYPAIAASIVGMVTGMAGAGAWNLMSDGVSAADPGLWAGAAVLSVLAAGRSWFRGRREGDDAEPEIAIGPAEAASLPGQTVAFDFRGSAAAPIAVPRGAHGRGELA